MLIRPRRVAIYVNRFPRLYRVPTIIGMARGYRKRGIQLILAVDDGHGSSAAMEHLTRRVAVESFRTFALRAVQGYRSRWFNLLFSPAFLFRCLQLRPTVIVQEGVGGWAIVSPLLKLLFGTKVVVSFERTETSEIRASGLKTLYQRLYFQWVVDKVVANGSRTARLLSVRLGYTGTIAMGNLLPYVPRRTRFMSSPIHTSATPPPSPESRASGERARVHVVVVMLMIERKGVDRLVRLLKGLAADTSVRWTIIGTGAQVSAVTGIPSPNIVHIPEVPPHRVYDFYRAADYLVLPTREDNWSLVVHEAMACGVVPITTIENGVVPDLVDSLSGHVLDFDSPFMVDDLRAILGRGPVSPQTRAAQQERARRIGTHLRVASSFVLPA